MTGHFADFRHLFLDFSMTEKFRHSGHRFWSMTQMCVAEKRNSCDFLYMYSVFAMTTQRTHVNAAGATTGTPNTLLSIFRLHRALNHRKLYEVARDGPRSGDSVDRKKSLRHQVDS